MKVLNIQDPYLEAGSAFVLLFIFVAVISERTFRSVKNEPTFVPGSKRSSHLVQVTTTRSLVDEYMWTMVHLMTGALDMLTEVQRLAIIHGEARFRPLRKQKKNNKNVAIFLKFAQRLVSCSVQSGPSQADETRECTTKKKKRKYIIILIPDIAN